MTTENQYIQAEHRDPSFFAMIPFMVIEDLDPHALAVYCHYKRVICENPNGKCWKSAKRLAEECGMSLARFYQARADLQERKLIHVELRAGETSVVTLMNIWPENHRRHQSERETEGGLHNMERGLHNVEGGLHIMERGSPYYGDKEESLKEEEISKKTIRDGTSRAIAPLYGSFKGRVPPASEGKEAGTSEDGKLSFNDERFPAIGQDVLRILHDAGISGITSLTHNQIALLTSDVRVKGVGVMPSPEAEKRDFPSAWIKFINHITEMPAWDKRFNQQRERVTASKVIDFLTNYHWKGGWLEYRPTASEFQEEASLEILGVFE